MVHQPIHYLRVPFSINVDVSNVIYNLPCYIYQTFPKESLTFLTNLVLSTCPKYLNLSVEKKT